MLPDNSCLSRFLSPSCFYCMRAKLCLLYLSTTFVKPSGGSYLECKNTELLSGWQSIANIYEMLEELICLCLCSRSMHNDYPDLSVYFQEHSGSYSVLNVLTSLIHYEANPAKKETYSFIQHTCTKGDVWQPQITVKGK